MTVKLYVFICPTFDYITRLNGWKVQIGSKLNLQIRNRGDSEMLS